MATVNNEWNIKDWDLANGAILIAELRAIPLSEQQMGAVLTVLDNICHECWNGSVDCQCWNDE